MVGKRLDRQVDAPAGRRVAEHGGARDDAFKTPSRKQEGGRKKGAKGERNRIRVDRVVTRRSNSARVNFSVDHFRTCNFESFRIDRGTIDKNWRIEIAFN